MPTQLPQIRCNGLKRCRNCSQAALECSYDAVPQKKGPKGSRANIISELRENRKRPEPTKGLTQDFESSLVSPTFTRTPSLLNDGLIDSCADFFFTYMYPTMPILHEEQVQQIVSDIDRSVEAYCLICSLSAFMLIQPGVELRTTMTVVGSTKSINDTALGTALLDEALRIRKSYEYVENPTINTIITSFFIFGCCFALNKHNMGWLHLREATALAQLVGMQEEQHYMTSESKESCRERRLFWLLFVTERQVISRYPKTHRMKIYQPSVFERSNTS